MQTIVLAGFAALEATAQSPRVQPLALERGKTQEVVIRDEGASRADILWTSFGGAATRLRKPDDTDKANEARFQIHVPENSTLGVGLMRLVGSNLLSAIHWVFIDELSIVADLPVAHSASNAPTITLPLGIEGHVSIGLPDVYRFQGHKDQVVSVDALGRRLDSRLSPVIQIFSSENDDIVYSNHDPSLGGDARFSVRLPRDDMYSLRVSDLYNKGGSDRGYYVRIGGFPIIDSANPFVVPKGGEADLVAFDSQLRRPFPIHVSGIPTVGGRTNVPVRDAGLGFTFARVLISELPEISEVEDNQTAAHANPIKWPTGISGKFDRRGDVDWFRFHVEKGESLSFRAFSKTLGSPADVILRLHRMDGSKLIELNVNSDPDPYLNQTFAEAGDYLLRVWESTGLGGTHFNYRVEVTTQVPSFKLTTSEEHALSVSNRTVSLKVTADRKGGYNGPIRISAIGSIPLKLSNEVIAADKKETDLSITLTDATLSGKLLSLRLLGSTVGTNSPAFEAPVSTRGVPMFKRMGSYLMPREFDGDIALLFP